MPVYGRTERDRRMAIVCLNLGRSPEKIQVTFCGKVRAFPNLACFEWVYLFLSILGLSVCNGLTLARMLQGKQNSGGFTFGILLLLTIVFCCYYVIHAVLTQRGEELFVFVISNVILVTYCTMNYFSQEYVPMKLARFILIWIFSPLLIILGVGMAIAYCRTNELVYNTVGPNEELQKACKWFYRCSSLLKFDLQLQLSMVVLVMGSSGSAVNLEQRLILGFGIFLSIFFTIIGYLGLKRESYLLMCLFYFLGLADPAYIAYKLYYAEAHGKHGDAVYGSIFACGVMALLVWASLMIATGIFISKGFNKGLKEKMFGDSTVPLNSTVSQVDSSDMQLRNVATECLDAWNFNELSNDLETYYLPLLDH